MKTTRVRDVVCISDTHCGSSLALSCRHKLDDGGYYEPSPLQQKVGAYWDDFWKWVYASLEGRPFVLVHNGDMIEGQNKNRTTALTTGNLTVQGRIVMELLKPHIDKAERYFQIRGTEAHVGIAAQEEEMLAALLGAEKDDHGNYSRWELFMKFGAELLHFGHHIGSTSSTAYESSAPMRELAAGFTESGQHGLRPPTVLIRSHRHRFIHVRVPGGQIVVTPAWQLKTPYVHRMDRLRAPQFGGLILSLDQNDKVRVQDKLYFVKENKAVMI